jgi:hypothetical protein
MAIRTARFTHWASIGSVGWYLSKANGSIARQWAQAALNANGIGEASVEKRNALDTALTDREGTGQRIDSGDPEHFASG